MAQQNTQRPGTGGPYQRNGSHFAASSGQSRDPRFQQAQGRPRPQGSRFQQAPGAAPTGSSNPYSRAAYGAGATGGRAAGSAQPRSAAGAYQQFGAAQAPVPSMPTRRASGGHFGSVPPVSGAGMPPVPGGPRNGGSGGRRGGRGTTIAAVILLVVGLGLLIAALAIYLSTQHNYQVGKDEYAALAKNVTEDTATSEPIVDFATLKADNPEVVAWVQIPGTPVNYPVAQHSDNDYYLEHTFTDQYNLAGSVFLDYRSMADASGYTTAIYGHHLKNGEMFAKIADYSDQAEFDAIPGVYYVTDGNVVHDLVPIGAMVVDGADTDVLKFDFASDADFQAYVQTLLDRCSARRADVNLAGVTHLYMLSTCSYERENDRTILLAVDRSQAGAAAHDASQDIEDIRSAADQAVSVVTGEPVPTEGEPAAEEDVPAA